MKILGISAFYHDAAAAIIHQGEIIAAAQEERFTRKKHDADFPQNAIRFCLEESGFSLGELDAIVFYDKPLLKFERLLETYYAFAPRGWHSFITAMPVWLKDKIFLKRLIRKSLKEIEAIDTSKIKLLFPEHHLSHAASAFYPSPFEEAAILTIDGVGEWATATIMHGKGKNISLCKEMKFPHSLGLLYSAVTYYCGFKVNSGEYKLMGLAPYGDANAAEVAMFKEKICAHIVDIHEDGSLFMEQSYFQYATGLTMTASDKWEQLLGLPRRLPEAELTQSYCNLALAIQQITEEVVLKMAKTARAITGAKHLCMAGGVALNCVANGKLQQAQIFEEIFIQPAAGDAGGSMGAALAAFHIYFDQERTVVAGKDGMKGSYLGPQFCDGEIEKMAKKYKANYVYYPDFQTLSTLTATHLKAGNVVGWFQGKMEFGPRALGNRSILGDAQNAEMQQKMNVKIKFRESFRPFAPAVLAEAATQYFALPSPSPYMLLVQPVLQTHRLTLPDNYLQADIRTKLYTQRSTLPAITHIDFSARIQTVHKETNPRFHQLICDFQALTGIPMLVNTSFNVRGEPIVCTPEDAYKCLMRTEMDYLVIGNYLFDKQLQPQWTETNPWQTEFVLD